MKFYKGTLIQLKLEIGQNLAPGTVVTTTLTRLQHTVAVSFLKRQSAFNRKYFSNVAHFIYINKTECVFVCHDKFRGSPQTTLNKKENLNT